MNIFSQLHSFVNRGTSIFFKANCELLGSIPNLATTPVYTVSGYHYYRMKHWSMLKIAKNLGLFVDRG